MGQGLKVLARWKRYIVMSTQNETMILIPQYSLRKILMVWAAAAIPMALLGWLVAPAMANDPDQPGFERLAILTVGLVWQFILTLILLYQETGSLRWSILKERLWLRGPRSPKTGQTQNRFFWWLIPLILLTAIFEMTVSGVLDKLWISVFPFLAEPSGLSMGAALDSPEWKSKLVGAWGILALYIFQAIFNTVLGEELLFRGLLLPRMSGVFGKWDWVMNGILFGTYHLHQPWMILSAVVQGMFLLALPSRYYRSAWFGIVAHSGQSVFFTILILGLVLGLA
jgi:membrane protease YdiL (CAAX protease family)